MKAFNYRRIWERVLLDNIHMLSWFNYARKVTVLEDGTFKDDWAYQKTKQHFPKLIRIYEERIAEARG